PDVGNSFAGGTVIFNGAAANFSHTGLTASTKYFYKAFSYDGSNNYSPGVTDNATTKSTTCTTPNTPGSISGSATVCQGANNIPYSVIDDIGNTFYSWDYTGKGATT